MAEPYQPISVNTGSSQQAIQATPNVTPALDGLMSSIKEGFISADDIRKRVASGPLEAATRAQDTADVTQVRPLQRQAAVAELQNVQAKQQFEASQLPILNEVKRETLARAFDNAKQFGVPEEVLKVFYASVPGFIPFDPDKLHDKKTGQVNLPYAIEMTHKAQAEARKIALNKGAVQNIKSENTNAQGAKEAFEQLIDLRTGQPLGPKIPTGTVAPDAVKAATTANQMSEGLRKEFYNADTVQAFNKVDAALNKIRLSATPAATPFQDMSSIFGFMKVLDPGSTVREGEYATVEKSRGWPDAFRGMYNKALEGTKLTPEQKKQLLASAEENYQGQLTTALPAIRQFAELETKNGFEPGTIVPVEFTARLTPAAPAPGATVAPGTPTAQPPLIDDADPTAAAAALRALPPNVRYARLKGRPGFLVENPNYRP